MSSLQYPYMKLNVDWKSTIKWAIQCLTFQYVIQHSLVVLINMKCYRCFSFFPLLQWHSWYPWVSCMSLLHWSWNRVLFSRTPRDMAPWWGVCCEMLLSQLLGTYTIHYITSIIAKVFHRFRDGWNLWFKCSSKNGPVFKEGKRRRITVIQRGFVSAS